VRLDARDGVALASATGSQASAPTGWVVFNEKNEPQRARLEGGVAMTSQAKGRVLRGNAPAADLTFTAGGDLRQAHLSNGVTLHSEQQANGANTTRDWRSPVLDADFGTGKDGKLALAKLTGTGGVTVTGQTQQPGGKPVPSRMSADTIVGKFGPEQQLTRLVGQGHAQLEQTSQKGARQTASADRLEATLTGENGAKGPASTNSDIESATLDGKVSFSRQDGGTGDAMRGTAEHAVYDGVGDTVHLSGNPRVDQAGLQLSAERIDVFQNSGEAFAHRNVKATWFGGEKAGGGKTPSMTMGGSGPVHVVADDAEMQQATGIATFRGHARMWQQGSSITAPTIVLNRTRQTLEARAAGASQPVSLSLMNANANQKGKGFGASTLRVRAGDLRYSDAERKATLRSGAAGPVFADMGTATSSSETLDVVLLPPGNHAGPNGEEEQVDRIVARGNVQLSSGQRHGTGQQLDYSSETGDYVLTGTPALPPRLTDPAHGTVTGASLIFNTRDDSVRVEGEGRRTSTETTAPR
jgi:lipopolysaccharide export system protein LptA